MILDRMLFNSGTGNFEVSVIDSDKTFFIRLSDFKENEKDNAFALSSDICEWVKSNLNAVKNFCASKLLSLKNETWLDEEEEPLSEKEFVQKITLDSIIAFSDRSFTIYFNDNDLFWGHAIAVDVNKERTLTDANIAG